MSKSERIAEIIKTAQAAAQNHPNTKLAPAMTALKNENYVDAIKLLTQITGSSDIEKSTLSFNLAFAYYKLGKIDEMVGNLKKAEALGFNPNKIINLFFCAGIELLKTNNFVLVKEELTDAEKTTAFPGAEKAIGIFKYIIENKACPLDFKIDVYARLHEAYELLLVINPTQSVAKLSIAALKDAIKSYNEKDQTSRKLALTIYKKLGNIDLDEYLNEIKKSDNSGRHHNKAYEDLQSANNYLQSAFKIDENDPELLNNFGVAKHLLAKMTTEPKKCQELYKEAEVTLATAILIGQGTDDHILHYQDNLKALEEDLSLLGISS